ncbi:MAG: tripartite tricarboxylate transporter permease, partial [archaeon]
TGLTPGIHINLIGVFLVSLSISFLSSIEPIYFVVFIVAMAITHTFVDFIPSIFLGCPDTDTELSVLPGHELLKKGLGYEAITLTTYGSLAAIFILILIAFPSTIIISKTYNYIQNIIPYLLIIVSILLISLEKKKFIALFVFLLTGSLGLCVLNLEQLNQPLLPLLTGLFGSSMLILSIKNKIKIPQQEISKPHIQKQNLILPLLGSMIASPLCSFLPGLGSGQAAIIGNIISRTGRKGFLVLIGATNTLVMGFSFLSLYIISRTRTGAAVAIKEIIGEPSTNILILILIIILINGIISFFLTISLAKVFSQKIQNINYTLLSIITLIILTIIVFLVSGFLGLAVLTASTFTGIYSISLKVRRTQMMGCLLIPTIIFYLL